MTDDQLVPTSDAQSAPLRVPETGFELWRLRRGEHLMICELRNERIGVDVLTRDAIRWAVLTERCASQAHAEFVGMRYRRTYLRLGWTAPR